MDDWALVAILSGVVLLGVAIALGVMEYLVLPVFDLQQRALGL